MEAVKKLPMISFELKNSPEPTSFQSLKQCIAEYYHEDPDSYSKEFHELESLRGLAIVRPRVDFECCTTIKRYYSQLHSLQNRFPLSPDSEMLTFTWKDIYSGNVSYHNNIKYEMASILYNIAALHSKLGVEESRSDPESQKIACTHFQCAAWAFGEIKERYGHVLKNDLTVELMIYMQQVSFAQAQECILEKSLADNRKAAIIAKVTAQVISFYNAAMSALFSQNEDGSIQDLVGSKVYKEWHRYIKFKSSYLSSILFMYQGQHSEEQRKMGERVALYNAACEKLEEAKKECKGMSKIEVINEALTLATDIIEGKRKNAKSENDFIYHESIPEISSIAAIQGANLVQGIPFDVTDPEVIGEDIFKRLVPMKTHEHLSVYSEEKANILRSLGAKIDDRDVELDSFMSSLNNEMLNAMNQAQERLPQSLVTRCAELSAKPNAIQNLIESMSNLADICSEVEISLQDIKQILDDENRKEQEYQKQMGKRPTGHMSELNREYTKYSEAHNKAGESNDTLRKAMELHVNNLKILAQPLSALKSQVPQCEQIDETTRKELETLLNKVEEMRKQRDGLYSDLRDQILNKDDITAQLVAHGDKDVEDLFQKELKKYSKSVSIIEQNLVAQGNILRALTETYAKHAIILKQYNDTKLKREQFFASLIASYDVYEDLLAKSAKGLDFYKKLHGNIQKLTSRVKAARDVQEEERQQLLKNAMAKAQPPVEVIKPVDYKSMMASAVPSSTGSGGPKLKDYLKSGMIPGMGGLRDDLSKLPAVRPSPLGQENVSLTNPSACPSMSYQQQSKYPTQQSYYQYPSTDQHSVHSGSGSLSSSTTSLNANDYYPQGSNYVMPTNQGYVNPIYQMQGQQNKAAAYSHTTPEIQMAPTNYSTASYQNYVQPSNASISSSGMVPQYGNYAGNYSNQQPQMQPEIAATNSQQQQFYDYYKNLQQPVVTSSPTPNLSYSQMPTNYQTIQNQSLTQVSSESSIMPNMYQAQYPVAQSPVQSYPVAPSPALSQYSGTQTTQQYSMPQQTTMQPTAIQQQTSMQQQTPVPQQTSMQQQTHVPQQTSMPQQTPVPQQTPMQQQTLMSSTQSAKVSSTQQYSNIQPVVSHISKATIGKSQQDYLSNQNQQNYFSYNNQSCGQPVATTPGMDYQINPYGQYDQYGNLYSQQNYSCFTPTVNSENSYMNSGNSQSSVTQSISYNSQTDIAENPYLQAVSQTSVTDSPQRQPNSIPTNTPAMASMPTNSFDTHSTNSSQNHQISSSTIQPIPSSSSIAVPSVPVASKPVEKSENMDLLSGIDFSMSAPSVENIPTLMPVSVLKKEASTESPKKVETIMSPVKVASKLNDDLADLDFSSLSSDIPRARGKEILKPRKMKDPFDDSLVVKQFHKEVESLEKFIETLMIKTLNGVTPLANKWKELQDLLVKDEAKRSVSVAKLFPDKNRMNDCLPYDHARVQLQTSTDNYINAVLVKDCGSVPFILTQTPMLNTVNDYWEMVWSQKSNTLVCLHSATEILDPFWPQHLNEEKTYGEVSVVLVKQFEFSHCHEKMLKVTRHGSDGFMNISLLQIKAWKKNSADQIIDIANNIITSFKQQNPDDRQQFPPIILNCLSGGAERSGIIALGISAIMATQMRRPNLLNVIDHWFRICSQRKGALEDESYIQLSFQVVLNNAHRILNKRGIMTSYQMKNAEKIAATETEKDVKDSLQELDPFWKFK